MWILTAAEAIAMSKKCFLLICGKSLNQSIISLYRHLDSVYDYYNNFRNIFNIISACPKSKLTCSFS
jgi:hypothetical protein